MQDTVSIPSFKKAFGLTELEGSNAVGYKVSALTITK